MGRVITYGSFDLFHWGHVELLARAKRLGVSLYVGLSTDEFAKEKGRETVLTYDERHRVVAACRYVDVVFPEAALDQKKADIKRFEITTFVMGEDWWGKFDDLPCEVVYLPRTAGISSTIIKKRFQ